MFGITEKTLKRLREEFPKGSRVMLVHMSDPFTKMGYGEIGTVEHVDDIGTIHVKWDCGSGLGVVYGEDECVKVEEK